eukprot:TRINITY_DN736_c0_g1_i1.p1 TRINITY_DN736_c0_g1~~TRINITY_DN736_c0_g1_i1.p1  ORF type:complete len:301 (+),score=52.27 TRINITY_DN736_c0_g1_i1:107-1009(+)
MKGTLAILVCLAIVGVVSANYFPAFPVHSFLWAGNRYFTTQNEECLSTLRTNALSDFVAQSHSDLSKYVSQDATTPEVLVVFVEDKSALSHSAYAFLQPVLSRGASSVLLPYVYRDGEQTTSEAIRAAFTAAPNAHVLTAGANIETLQAELAEKKVFSNGVVDLLVVRLSLYADKAATVEAVDTLVQQATSGQYVAMFTADSEFKREQRTPSQKEVEVHRRVQQEEAEEDESARSIRSVLEARDSNYYSQRKFWPKEIWEGIFVVVLLGVILVTGFWCTFELQTPQRWETAKANAHAAAQ